MKHTKPSRTDMRVHFGRRIVVGYYGDDANGREIWLLESNSVPWHEARTALSGDNVVFAGGRSPNVDSGDSRSPRIDASTDRYGPTMRAGRNIQPYKGDHFLGYLPYGIGGAAIPVTENSLLGALSAAQIRRKRGF